MPPFVGSANSTGGFYSYSWIGNPVAQFQSTFAGVVVSVKPGQISIDNYRPRARLRVFSTPRDASGNVLWPICRFSYSAGTNIRQLMDTSVSCAQSPCLASPCSTEARATSTRQISATVWHSRRDSHGKDSCQRWRDGFHPVVTDGSSVLLRPKIFQSGHAWLRIPKLIGRQTMNTLGKAQSALAWVIATMLCSPRMMN